MKDELTEKVCRMISKQCSIKDRLLVPSARLEEDLGVTGDDGLELMEAFFSTFNVQLADCVLGRHFGPEVQFAKPHPEFGAYSITVGHLVGVAKHGC